MPTRMIADPPEDPHIEPETADQTWGKLGGELIPVPVVVPPVLAPVTLLEIIWRLQLRLWVTVVEAYWGAGSVGQWANLRPDRRLEEEREAR